MKRTRFAAMLLLGLGVLVSCGGRNDASATDDNDSIRKTSLSDSLIISNNFQQDIKNHTDTMFMVIDSRGRIVGRYVRTNADTYTISVQDEVEVPIVGNKVVLFRAKDGQGVLYTKRTHVNIRQEPNTTSTVLTQISYQKGKAPTTYPCLGKTGDWYKIVVKEKEGYVRQDLVEWDGMSSF